MTSGPSQPGPGWRSPAGGQRSRRRPHLVEAVDADVGDHGTGRTRSPPRYCRSFSVEAQQAPDAWSDGPQPLPRRRSNFSRISATVGTTPSGPDPSITWSAWPSSSDITPVSRARISRWVGVWTRSTRLRPSSGALTRATSASPAGSAVSLPVSLAVLRPVLAGEGLHGLPDPLDHRGGVQLGLAEEGLDLALDVVAQPRHAENCHTDWTSSCRHTHSRKSCGSTSSSRSTCTMFRRHQQQPAGPRLAGPRLDRPCRHVAAGRREGLVLPEHPGGQEAQQHPRPRHR